MNQKYQYQVSNIMDLTVKGSNSETGHRIHAIVLASVSSKFQDQLSPGKTISFPFPDKELKAIIGIASRESERRFS